MVERLPQVEQAIAKMRSLHDSGLSVLEVIECGRQAIPALRKVLFEREGSGLYEVRCRAVQALAAIGAHDVLMEFLETEHSIADPIERLGEDAVINAAALALVDVQDQRVFELLLRLAQRPALSGVIGALGAFERVEGIPALINALEEDASRLTAEAALRKFGHSARASLLRAVDMRVPSSERESESSVRRRRSALRLLAALNVSPAAWRDLRHLTYDKDARISALACEIGLVHTAEQERPGIVRRLIELLGGDDWILREEIEACLRAHANTHEAIGNYLNEVLQSGERSAPTTRTEAILRRVIAGTQSVPNT